MLGLDNLGNTCYLNSILQILMNTPGFLRLFMRYKKQSKEPRGSTSDVATSFGELMDAYHHGSPDATKHHLVMFIRIFHQSHDSFGLGFGQHDQHEYLMFLLRAIHDSIHVTTKFNILSDGQPTPTNELELASLKALRVDGMSTTDKMLKHDDKDNICYDSIVTRMFTGQYRSQTECQNPACKYMSNRFETFRSWELSIGHPDKDNVKLEESMNDFIGITQLDEEDSYECDKCKQRTRSLRKCTLWRLPEILVITLKRNIYHNVGHRHVSIKDPRVVHVPLMLDVKPYLSASRKNTKYKLYSTANHLGTPHGGHCYSQILEDDKWFVVNDIEIKEGLAHASHVYILFYQRMDQ